MTKLTAQERESIVQDLDELDRIVKEGGKRLDKKGNAQVKSTERGSEYWLVCIRAEEYKVGKPDPNVGDVVSAAYLIAEKMRNKLAGDRTARQIEEAQNRALEHAEQLTVDDHGNLELNPVPEGYHEQFNPIGELSWNSPELARITRARWIGDVGVGVDLSYCHGVNKRGNDVRVRLPNELHHIRGATSERALRKVILDVARKYGVYAKDTGIFEAMSLYVN